MDDRCFACGRKLGANPVRVDTRDGQTVFVGRECAKLVAEAGDSGWKPPKGGPRLFPIATTPSPTALASVRGLATEAMGEGATGEPVEQTYPLAPAIDYPNYLRRDEWEADVERKHLEDIATWREALEKWQGYWRVVNDRLNEVQRLLTPEQRSTLIPWARPIDDPFPLHPETTHLVAAFGEALRNKLARAEAKYGYTDGWLSPNWMEKCREKLMEHIEKGDPLDVAAYCAFLWHHGASTAGAKPSMRTIADLAEVFDEGVRNGAALSRPAADPTPTSQGQSAEVAGMVPLTDDEINWHYADSDLQPQLYDKRGMFEAGVRYAERHHRIAAAPVGMVLVPREPTEAMLAQAMKDCGGIGGGSCGEHTGIDSDDLRSVWESMIAAAGTNQDKTQ